MPSPASLLILPGYGGSGPAHWQTLWELRHPGLTRVEEPDWGAPDRATWVANLEAAVRAAEDGVVLVAHSLACLQVAHWVATPGASLSRVRAALLVAPPDPEGPAFPGAASGFSPVPRVAFPFETVLVGSEDDPYAAPDFAPSLARAFGARFVSVGARGHVNAASGLGAWDEGWRMVEELRLAG